MGLAEIVPVLTRGIYRGRWIVSSCKI